MSSTWALEFLAQAIAETPQEGSFGYGFRTTAILPAACKSPGSGVRFTFGVPPSPSPGHDWAYVESGIPRDRVAGTVTQGGSVVESGEVESHIRNPAGRLYLFFMHCKTGGPQEHALLTVANYFGLPPQFTPELFRAVSELSAQPELLRAAVGALEPSDHASDILEDIPQVEEALGALLPNLNGALSDFVNRYDSGTTRGLKAASRTLNSARTLRSPLTTSRLNDLKDLAQAIIDALADDDDIEAELRSLLFHHASRIREAVDLFKVGGLGVVLVEYDRLRGALERAPESTAQILRTPKLKDRVGAVLVALNLIAGLGNTAVAIEQGAEAVAELMAVPPQVVLAPGPIEPSSPA